MGQWSVIFYQLGQGSGGSEPPFLFTPTFAVIVLRLGRNGVDHQTAGFFLHIWAAQNPISVLLTTRPIKPRGKLHRARQKIAKKNRAFSRTADFFIFFSL